MLGGSREFEPDPNFSIRRPWSPSYGIVVLKDGGRPAEDNVGYLHFYYTEAELAVLGDGDVDEGIDDVWTTVVNSGKTIFDYAVDPGKPQQEVLEAIMPKAQPLTPQNA